MAPFISTRRAGEFVSSRLISGHDASAGQFYNSQDAFQQLPRNRTCVKVELDLYLLITGYYPLTTLQLQLIMMIHFETVTFDWKLPVLHE